MQPPGNQTPGFSGDNGLATKAQLSFPCGLTVSSDNQIFIADFENVQIRKIAAGIITPSQALVTAMVAWQSTGQTIL